MYRVWCAVLLLAASVSCQDMVTSVPPPPPPGEPALLPTTSLEKAQVKPTIRSLHITTDIKYRYATTLVSTRVINPTNQSGEATFTVTLPESAFISQFLMEIKDKVYKAYVKEKEEAKAIYQEAVQSGHFAGHVALDARDSNQFTVSVNIEAHGKVTFNLTYEQLLARNLGVYSNVINIDPQQIVDDMSVTVNIEEPSDIIDLEVPELQMSNEAIPEKRNELAKIKEISPKHKQVTWAPTADEQRSKKDSGLSGQFIVKYDVDRKDNPQQILVDEGYFVHFFAPENLAKLRKHVIFVLDFSGSMSGKKLEQLKEAMQQILSDLGPKDYFSIVIFQSWVEVWSPSGMYYTSLPDYISPYDSAKFEGSLGKNLTSQYVVEASAANIEAARTFMANYTDLGSTNIMGGLRTGLKLVEVGEEVWANESDPPQPVMVFLTDGQPNVEEYDTRVIITKTKALNTKQSPIFSLAFGYGADFNFLRKLSLQNSGFARNIYEAADASQQLKNFYKTIASPLLSNVTVYYLPGQVDNSSNTKQEFPVFFSGSELVVAGRVNSDSIADDKAIGELRGQSATGPQVYPIICRFPRPPKPENRTTGHLEKAWSYLTIQQLLDKADSLDDGEEKNKTKKQALDLALQYAFVTPLTSLVVVKPNETESSVDATKINPGMDGGFGAPQYALSSGAIGAGFGGAGGVANFAMMAARPAAPAFPMYGAPQPAPLGIHATTTFNPHPLSTTSDIKTVSDATTPRPPQKVSLEDIKWLQQALNGTEKSVTIAGDTYNLGLNETDSAFGDCVAQNMNGECLHIQYCPLDYFMDDVTEFLPFKCSIPGQFLGVCCPKPLL